MFTTCLHVGSSQSSATTARKTPVNWVTFNLVTDYDTIYQSMLSIHVSIPQYFKSQKHSQNLLTYYYGAACPSCHQPMVSKQQNLYKNLPKNYTVIHRSQGKWSPNMNYSGQDLMLFRYYLTCFSTVWPHDLTLLTVDWSKSYTCATGFNHRLCSHSHSQVEIGIELKNCDPEGR